MKKIIKVFALCVVFAALFASCQQNAKVEEIPFETLESADIDFSKIDMKDNPQVIKSPSANYGADPVIGEDDGDLIITAAGNYAKWDFAWGLTSLADIKDKDIKVKISCDDYDDGGNPLKFHFIDTDGNDSELSFNGVDIPAAAKTLTFSKDSVVAAWKPDPADKKAADLTKICTIMIDPQASKGTYHFYSIKFVEPKEE